MTSSLIVPICVVAFVLVVIVAVVASYIKVKRCGLPALEEAFEDEKAEPAKKLETEECCCGNECCCDKLVEDKLVEDELVEDEPGKTCEYKGNVVVVDEDATPKPKKPRKQTIKAVEKAIADLTSKIAKRSALLKSIKKPASKDETLKGWKEKLAILKATRKELKAEEKEVAKAVKAAKVKPAKKPTKKTTKKK